MALGRLLAESRGTAKPGGLPSLSDMFFARIAPKDGGEFDQDEMFRLKYNLRGLMREQQGEDPRRYRELRHDVMGTVEKVRGGDDTRVGSKIFMSRPYNNGREMRVWGWVPRGSQVQAVRESREWIVQDCVKFLLDADYGLVDWLEADAGGGAPGPDETLALYRRLMGVAA